MNENICCFTGHRDLHSDCTPERIKIAIEVMINRGVDTFLSGGAVGFDTMAGFAVNDLKEKYPHIKLHIYVPCINQDCRFDKEQKEDYKRLLSIADKVERAEVPYSTQAMYTRNRKLVDNSNYCICYIYKTTGGTAYTAKYAISKGKTIFNVSKNGVEILQRLK